MVKTNYVDKNIALTLSGLFSLLIFSLLLFLPLRSFAEDSLCARVKIEIKQELTLERQAFDAHMTINNGIANISLEKIRVEVSFADEQGNIVLASSDPENTNALFFITVDSMENINDVDGLGSISPSTCDLPNYSRTFCRISHRMI